MTPAEIRSRILSGNSRRQTGDLMAWIAARYIMLAVHLPDKMPDGPVFFPEHREDMTPEQMKDRFSAWKEQTT